MHHLSRLIASAFLLVSLIACSGGGGSTPTAPSNPTPTPPTPTQPVTPTVSGLTVTGPGCSASPTAGTLGSPKGVCSASSASSTIQLVATAQMSDGTSKDVGGQSSWATTNASVASVSTSGLVTVKANGDADVTASYQGRVAGQTIHVAIGPRTVFGAGQYLVNTDIVANRYYADTSYGCYFERLRGLSGSLGDIIANEFIGFDAGQWIVDIKAADKAFSTDADCGTWYDSPRKPAQASITAGMWLVGAQIPPGTYRADVSYGCYWERLGNFSGELGGILSNDFVSSASQRLVTIRATDIGFRSDVECNTWTRVSGVVADGFGYTEATAPGAIEANKNRARTFRGEHK